MYEKKDEASWKLSNTWPMHRCVQIFWTWMLRLDVNLDWDGTNMYRSGVFGLKQLCDMKQLLLYSVCGYQFLIIDPHKLADSFNESENKCYDFFCWHKFLTPAHMPWWLIYGRIKMIYTHQILFPNRNIIDQTRWIPTKLHRACFIN